MTTRERKTHAYLRFTGYIIASWSLCGRFISAGKLERNPDCLACRRILAAAKRKGAK